MNLDGWMAKSWTKFLEVQCGKTNHKPPLLVLSFYAKPQSVSGLHGVGGRVLPHYTTKYVPKLQR